MRTSKRALALLFGGLLTACSPAPDAAVAPAPERLDDPVVDATRGSIRNTDRATPGHTMYGGLLSDTTYLIDSDGMVVHTWKSEYAPSGTAYLLDNGNIVRGGRQPEVDVFNGGGQGGRLQEITWGGEVVWDYLFASEDHLLHHDFDRMPNGNILAIAWERKSAEETRAGGRRVDLIPEHGLWPDMVVELEPLPPDGARIVWEWHMWDHLVQDADASHANHGDPAAHPERIDINGTGAPVEISDEELAQLQALGYVPADADAEELESDLFHTNALHYNAELDQILLSVPEYNELWIIDHSTTTEEAASSSGGRAGRGGDLLYRWGNPQVYGRGGPEDQVLGYQHDARWIPQGHPGAGNILVFSNRNGDEDNSHSAVYEIAPPIDGDGNYGLPETEPFGPAEPVWSYTASDPTTFFAPFISGASRLAGGNTLVNSGPQGRFFEVTSEGEIVWEYRDPYSGDVRMPDGSMPHPVDEFTYAVFRATRIPPGHPGLAGRTLVPLDPQPVIPEPPAEEAIEDEASDEEAPDEQIDGVQAQNGP